MTRPEVPEGERDLGLGFYSTRTRGIGGRLKVHPEDFQVAEDSAPAPRAQEEGKYTLARIRAKDWETHRLARQLARELGIRENDVYFTGTKDKRAVTVQNVTLRAPEEDVQAVSLGDVEILDTWRVDRAPKLGEHRGNDFRIRIREFDLSLDEAVDRAEGVRDEIVSAGGFPNFFGVQRFGSVRPVTHRVGRALVHGSFEEAVWTYIAYPSRRDPPEIRRERREIFQERDVDRAHRTLPQRFDHEHRMLDHLSKNPGDAVGAMETLPLNLARLFVSAYQSHLFNRALTERAALSSPVRAEPGDVLVPIDETGNPDKDRRIPVTGDNLSRCRKATRRGWGLPTGLLPGYDEGPAGGTQGEIESQILDAEAASLDDFRILDLPKLSADGTRRPLWCPLDSVSVEGGEDDHGPYVELAFDLPKGSYATCLLREFMKADLETYC